MKRARFLGVSDLERSATLAVSQHQGGVPPDAVVAAAGIPMQVRSDGPVVQRRMSVLVVSRLLGTTLVVM